MGIKIKKLEKYHIEQVVDIYFSELDVSVLTYFGKEFIRNMCNILLQLNWGFVAVYSDGGQQEKVVGFIFLDKIEVSLYRCLSLYSLLHLIKRFFLYPKSIVIFLVAFFRLFLIRNRIISRLDNYVEISHFAILKEYQGQGVGTKLIAEAEQLAVDNNYRSIVTSSHNERLIQYYKRTRNAVIIYEKNIVDYTSRGVQWFLNDK